MPVTTNKRYCLRIIILFTLFSCAVSQLFASDNSDEAGPVISSVNINSCQGSISISVTSGVLPYSYVWRDSGGTVLAFTSFVASGLTAGDYSVEVTDGNGDSTGPATYTVTNPPDLVGAVVVNDVTCRGDSDAQVVVTMGNGNPGYDWELFNAGGTSVGTGSIAFPNNVITISGLGIGNYTLSTEDQDGCTGNIAFTVTQPADALNYSIGASTDATCFNSTDGSISATGTGGWGNYTYQWIRLSDNTVIGTAATINGLAPGNYRLDIIDRNGMGCTVSTPTLTINSPAEITPTVSITNTLCNGDANGAIDLSVTGGVGPYTYLWSNGATTQDISGLAAGNYSVTITDNSGCTDAESFTVTEPAVLTISPNITNVDCFGDNSGRIRSNVTGGTAPYTYAWSTGNTGRNLNNRVAGTYTLTVTDANGCVATAGGLTVTQPAMALSKLTDVQNNPACFGNSDGSITINMQGGTAGYTYLWSNGDNTNTATGLNAGAHSVTVTDAAGCTYNESFTLADPLRIAVTPTLTLPTCNGGADGAITVSAANGTGPYTYNWNTGASGATISALVAGTYSVTVTDAGGCEVVESIVLGEPTVLTGNATVNNISCNGLTDGSISLAVGGGTAPYTYAWNTGATTNNISGLGAGGYSVTITDASGCSIVENYTIIDPAPIGVAFTQTNIVCKGAATGAIDITPSGGTAPYSYSWSNGATTEDLSNIVAGNYSVTITDASNCAVVQNVTITEPALVLNLSGTETNATCNGSNNGSIDLTVTGGSGPYVYSWNTGATSEDITGLAPGNYSATVTDANGCIKSVGFTISEPAPLAASPSKTDITCNGANDGSITINVSGGTAPYTYAWADDVTITTNTRTSLSSGNYTVTVTDANGCIDVESLTIIEPAQLTSSDVVQNVNCFGESTGSINLSISGGVGPYSFSWSNGALTEDLTNISAGNYSVTVTDVNGCTINDSFTITQPSSALTKTEVVQQITCNGAANGIINLTATGGSAPYSYNWSNGSTSEDLSSLSAGTYSVTITDNNGCTINDSYVITDPPLLGLSGTKTDITCFGADDGNIDVTVTGGEAPYTYAWSNGAITEDVSGLAPGNYTVNITDNRGCTTNQMFNIQEPAVLSLGHSLNNVTCFGDSNGAIDITVSGGTAPYNYAWSNASTNEDLTDLAAANYTVTVTDANGCSLVETIIIAQPAATLSTAATVTDISCFGGNDGSLQLTPAGGTAPYTYSWNTGSTNKDIFGLSDGSYQVTITDANGCAITETYAIAMPPALLATGTQVNVLCNGANTGSIDLSVTGGTGLYSYTWSNGASTQDLTNIGAGNYTVTIADARGCSINRAFSITQPLALNLADNINDVSCFGDGDGSIDISVSGGIAPYTYSWSGGQTTQDRFNLSGGNYTLTVTDANGCQSVNTYTVSEPTAALAVAGAVTNETCFGDNQGAVALNISGGTAPYSYSWNQGSSSKDIFGLSQGAYQVTITDSQGCSIQQAYTVSGPPAVSLSADVTTISCNGVDDGSIDLTISGGTGPFTYAWGNGSTTQDLNSLTPGSYAVLVTDNSGCTYSANYTITEPLALTTNFLAQNVSCFGADDGSIDMTVSGGTLPYTYSWNNGAETEDISSLSGGDYELTVTDARGCQIITKIAIGAPSAPLNAAATIANSLCNGQPDGKVELAITGGTAPLNYSWSNGSSQRDLVNVFAGDYSVTITDAGGCVFTETYTVGEPAALAIAFDATSTSCFGDNDGSVIATASGGVGPYSYVWSNGSTSKDLANISGGTYNLTIVDANNCSLTRSVLVGDSQDLTVDIAKRDVLCKGESSGLIQLDVTGGSGSYTYTWNTGQTTSQLVDVNAGVYEVLISDAGGCSTTASIVISEPAEALTVVLADYADLLCFGDQSATIQALPQGGIAPYTYLWSNGERTSQVSGLGAGVYSVAITDANGCLVQESVTIGQPASPITIGTTGKLNLSCNGNDDGSINLNVTGGTGPYEYLWSTGDQGTSISDLSVGDYTVRVKDANDCVVERIFTISEPIVLTLENAIVNESQCYDDRNGSIELNIEGGTAPYSYQWNTGATTKNLIGISSGAYEVLVTDTNGCQVQGSYSLAEPALFLVSPQVSPISCIGSNDASISLNIEGGIGPVAIRWSTGESTETLTGLSPGEYNVLVTDKKGCTIQNSFNIFDPLPLTLDAYIEDATKCNDPRSGLVNVIVSGGNEPYAYRWTNGSTESSIPNVLPGTYVVEVTDRLGCTVQGTYTVQQPEPLQVGFSTERYIDCQNRVAGVMVKANVKGGVGNYSYRWSKEGSGSSELLVVDPGRLTIEVVDERGCVQSRAIDIDIPEIGIADFEYNASSIDLTGKLASNDPVSFFDRSEGEIVDWKWEFGDGFGSDEIDPIHTYDSPGVYEVTLTVTDRTGCQTVKTDLLRITEGFVILAPTAFTPNGDGNNDFFRPKMAGLIKVRLTIYNTWGEVIFSTDDLETKGWDGTAKGRIAENGNYVFKLIGESFNGLKVERDGVFALLK